MSSAWGKTLGASWGNAWGQILQPQTAIPSGHSRRRREIDAEWDRQVLASRVAALPVAVKLAPSQHTEAIKTALAAWREAEQLAADNQRYIAASILQKAIAPDRAKIAALIDDQLDEEAIFLMLAIAI